MNYTEIKKALSDYGQNEVDTYLTYLNALETDKSRDGQLRNPWFSKFKETNAIYLFKKVAADGLFIDGETITLQNKGKVLVSYGYQAYRQRIIILYPESTFDIQIVHKGDEFSFWKESGSVHYTHSILNPFNPNPEIIGAYCIIKNSRGEFLEIINMTDVSKMRNVAKTKNVWDTWFSEMVLKSVIKRACKRHFKDEVKNIDNIDNENYDLAVKEEEKQLPELLPGTPAWKDALDGLMNNGYSIKDIRKKFTMTQENEDKLVEESL